MRINLNNKEVKEQVKELCSLYGDVSPTQLIINLINSAHAQQDAGGKDDKQTIEYTYTDK